MFGLIKRLDIIGACILASFLALVAAAAYAALHFAWFKNPWQLAAWLFVCCAFLTFGFGRQAYTAPKNVNVHGSAQPASEAEARAAARGEIKSPLHDQTFPD